MPIIYRPKGKAAEYAPLAINIYRGCAHGCKYCYAPAATRTDKKQFHDPSFIHPRKIIAQLEKEAVKLKGTKDKVLISFTSDPYQPIDQEQQHTRRVIEILGKNQIPFTVLTKAGMAATRDFDLLKKYGGEFGTSLAWTIDFDRSEWEPNGATVQSRALAIKKAHIAGIRTWVSIEPVIDPMQALGVIAALHEYVSHWKVGKINYNPELEKAVDWRAFCRTLREFQEMHGLDIYIKDSLKPYWED